MPLTNDGKIKEGLQEHTLFQMDGRIWIEPVFPPRTQSEARLREMKIERGWMTMIPRNALVRLVHEVAAKEDTGDSDPIIRDEPGLSFDR